MAELAARRHWEAILVALMAACVYLPAMRFGLIWDDPTWYQQGAGLSIAALFGPVPTFQFYRPLALLYNRLFVGPSGIVHAPALHLAQILYHSLNSALVVVLASRLGLSRWAACASGLAFALHPYAYQAVAWQAPQQPLATLCLLAIVLAGQRYLDGKGNGWRALSLAIFACALFYQEIVLGALGLLAALSWQARGVRRPWRQHAWLTGHAVVGGAFAALYAAMPKRMGVVGGSGRDWVGAYALQALIPPAGALRALPPEWPAWVWLSLFAALAISIGAMARRHRPRAAFLGSIWFAAGVAPTLAGLPWVYVSVGPRLLYPALVGVTLLWGAALDGLRRPAKALCRSAWLVVAAALLFALAHQTLQLQTLYRRATRHLQDTVQALADPSHAQVLLYNYPDSIALRRPSYALGYWGITLAPPVQRLEDYALAERGVSADATDVTRLDMGTAEWDASPYRADLRGGRVGPDGGMQPGAAYDAVYVTRVSARGELALVDVGWSAIGAASAPLATLGDGLQLQNGDARLLQPGIVRVELALWSVGPHLTSDTLFVHVLGAGGVLVAGQDGDLWGGFLPVFEMPADALVGETRYLDVSGLSAGDYAVTMGLYNRQSGLRYAALQPDGNAAWNGELQIATLHVK